MQPASGNADTAGTPSAAPKNWADLQKARVEELHGEAHEAWDGYLPLGLFALALLMVLVKASQPGGEGLLPTLGLVLGYSVVALAGQMALLWLLRNVNGAPVGTIPVAIARFLAVNSLQFTVLLIGGMVGSSLGLWDPHRGTAVAISVIVLFVLLIYLFEVDAAESIFILSVLTFFTTAAAFGLMEWTRKGTSLKRRFDAVHTVAPANPKPKTVAPVKKAAKKVETKSVKPEFKSPLKKAVEEIMTEKGVPKSDVPAKKTIPVPMK